MTSKFWILVLNYLCRLLQLLAIAVIWAFCLSQHLALLSIVSIGRCRLCLIWSIHLLFRRLLRQVTLKSSLYTFLTMLFSGISKTLTDNWLWTLHFNIYNHYGLWMTSGQFMHVYHKNFYLIRDLFYIFRFYKLQSY